MNWCEFTQDSNGTEVTCKTCGRRLSGSPSRYAAKMICPKRGPGEDFERLINKLMTLFNIKVPKCSNCNKVKLMMNKQGKQWCKENRALLTAMIQYNAKANGVKVPRMLISAALRMSNR